MYLNDDSKEKYSLYMLLLECNFERREALRNQDEKEEKDEQNSVH